MKYLLNRNLYDHYGPFNTSTDCPGTRVIKNQSFFNLKDEVHFWLEDHKIPYNLEIVDIDEKSYSDGEHGIMILQHRVGYDLYIDIDAESLILFKLTWG